MFKKELKEFKEFRNNYNFIEEKLTEKNGALYFKDEMVQDEKGNPINKGKGFINVGYKLKGGGLSKTLSNLFPYDFKFRGKKVGCLDGVFQGIKFKNIKEQNLVLKMWGTDAVNVKMNSDYDWKETGILYWQGEPINRFGTGYYNFIDELYISAIQNPLYRKAILNSGNLYIVHSIGKDDTKETVLARCEFQYELNLLKAFLQSKK